MPQTDAEPAASLVRSAETALDALRDSGLVDAERVCIMGQSYGAYTTLCVLTSSFRFRCGIAACGIYDLLRCAFDEAFWYTEKGQGRMRATPWENLQRHLDNSPLFSLQKLNVPLFMLHGSGDSMTSQQGYALLNSLRRLGKSYEFINAPGMGHAPARWSIEAQKEFIPRLLAFLDKHL